MIVNYKNLIVWQKAVDLATQIYELTERFPKSEIFGISSQMRRAAVSIPSNIAEGRCRTGKNEFRNFLGIAYGSAAELQTQLEIAKKLPFSRELDYNNVESKTEEVVVMLRSMISKISH